MPQGKGTYGSQVGRPPKREPTPEYKRWLEERTPEELKELEDVRTPYEQLGSLLESYENSILRKAPTSLINAKKRILYRNFSEEEVEQYKRERDEIEAIHARGRIPKEAGGEIGQQMSMLMEEEQPMLPDEEMEEDYVEFVMDSALDEKDKEYLESALAADGKLSEIFDTVVERASEFSGSGPIEGPGSGMSDSIPARLSDGEFVFTAKATEEIGADNLQLMMEDAEAAADERLQAYGGGSIEEPQVDKVVETTTSTRVLKPTSSTTPMLGQTEEDVLQDALTTNMLNRTTKHVQS